MATAPAVETIRSHELLRRVCAAHGWLLADYALELAVIGHGLWEIAEPLAQGHDHAADRLLERLMNEGLLR